MRAGALGARSGVGVSAFASGRQPGARSDRPAGLEASKWVCLCGAELASHEAHDEHRVTAIMNAVGEMKGASAVLLAVAADHQHRVWKIA